MRKSLLLLTMLVFCVLGSAAQESSTTKKVLIVDNFTMPMIKKQEYRAVVTGLRDRIIGEITKTKKVEIIDVATNAFFQSQREKAGSDEALDSALSSEAREAASKEFGAEFGLQGHVSHMAGVRKKLDNGSVYYAGEITVTLKVINLIDGTVVHSEDYSYAGMTAKTGDTDVAAITNTGNYLLAFVPKFVGKAFPTNGKIIDIAASKKGVATDVYIDLGENVGVKVKDKFKVYQVSIVAGRDVKTDIGSLTVSEVGGADISTCKVSKCGAQISESFANPDKVKLIIESVAKSAAGGVFKEMGKGLIGL